ncbi:hypothetical protein JOF28_000566 [Leucobacter exalbidus]|uniref:Type II toxin-antitoxin system PemK/MazF family toxin n=1 Tax=Leucobacter exalbidus TaxID=662960 RepID=A0A940T349_9MICO|nr:hypothetical protein [Leucobacter exalbidus]MBP1325334.1 hypothetical protein [Leucobacter exalbidus]
MLGQILSFLLDLLLSGNKKSGKGTRSNQGDTPSARSRRGGGPQPRLRAQPGNGRAQAPQSTSQSRNNSTNTGSRDGVESPGQYGPGATRELTAAEIAQLTPSYDPNPDGDPDPGEIVWTWVPYAENDGRGKDRPVLIIARIGNGATAGCYLSTKEHRGFISIGSGAWDAQGRESFLSPERVLRITNDGMRREGHVLDAAPFSRAVAQLARAQPLRGQR